MTSSNDDDGQPCKTSSAFKEIVEIRDLRYSELRDAAALLSRAMNNNPANVATLDADVDRRYRSLSRIFRVVVLGLFKRGAILGAFYDREVLGVCGISPPGKCQPHIDEQLRILPVLLTLCSLRASLRFFSWARERTIRDPGNPHWHLGPLAVDSDRRRKGVGGALVVAFAGRVDEHGESAYLETDKRENVRFYEKYGFAITSQTCKFGVPTWSMERSSPINSGSCKI